MKSTHINLERKILMKKQFLLLLLTLCALLTGCGRQETSPVSPAVPTVQTQPPLPTEAPETQPLPTSAVLTSLIPGQSTIEDAVRYYQETFPERNLYANFLDFDGNGWGDLAVWYQGCYLSICFMEEDYILAREVTFTETANLYEHWDGPTCQPNIVGTWELQENDTVSIETFYDISEGGLLSLRESFKYDGNGGDQKWFTIGDSDWVPISQEVYEERLNCYHGSAENLKPIEDYYLR